MGNSSHDRRCLKANSEFYCRKSLKRSSEYNNTPHIVIYCQLIFHLFLTWYSYILYLNETQKFFYRVGIGRCTVTVCCAESDSLIPERVHESVPPFHLSSRPQPSRLISAWLWWTHAPSVLGWTVFEETQQKWQQRFSQHTLSPTDHS